MSNSADNLSDAALLVAKNAIAQLRSRVTTSQHQQLSELLLTGEFFSAEKLLLCAATSSQSGEATDGDQVRLDSGNPGNSTRDNAST